MPRPRARAPRPRGPRRPTPRRARAGPAAARGPRCAGFRASIPWSASRLKPMAALRAPTMATRIQPTGRSPRPWPGGQRQRGEGEGQGEDRVRELDHPAVGEGPTDERAHEVHRSHARAAHQERERVDGRRVAQARRPGPRAFRARSSPGRRAPGQARHRGSPCGRDRAGSMAGNSGAAGPRRPSSRGCPRWPGCRCRRPAATPAASIAGTGGSPTPRRRLLRGHTATATPRCASVRMSASSTWTQCAATRRGWSTLEPVEVGDRAPPRWREGHVPETASLEEAGPLPVALGQERRLGRGLRQVDRRRPPRRTRARSSGAETECGAWAARRICTSAGQVFGDLPRPGFRELQHRLGLRRVPGKQLVEHDGGGEAGPAEHRQMGQAVRDVADRDGARTRRGPRGLRAGRVHHVRRGLARARRRAPPPRARSRARRPVGRRDG